MQSVPAVLVVSVRSRLSIIACYSRPGMQNYKNRLGLYGAGDLGSMDWKGWNCVAWVNVNGGRIMKCVECSVYIVTRYM